MKKAINVCFAFGAAVVVLGAWAKLVHKPYADIALTIGLLTEVALFIVMGIQELFIKDDTYEVPLQKIDSSDLSSGLTDLNNTLKQIFNR